MSNEKDILEVTVAELLSEDRDAEIVRRDGEWDAFTSAVFRRLDEEETEVERAELADQAVALLKQDVDLELSEMAPAFEEMFKESVEKRIFRSAIEEPRWTDRLKAWFEEQRRQIGFGLGWAGAAAAMAALLIAVVPADMEKTPNIEEQLASGSVSVQSISFEGDVTVLPEDGVTIIWLDQQTS